MPDGHRRHLRRTLLVSLPRLHSSFDPLSPYRVGIMTGERRSTDGTRPVESQGDDRKAASQERVVRWSPDIHHSLAAWSSRTAHAILGGSVPPQSMRRH